MKKKIKNNIKRNMLMTFKNTVLNAGSSNLWGYVYRKDLPYSMQKQKNGKWLVLNRYYKPVFLMGANTPHVKYEAYFKTHCIKLDEELVKEHCIKSGVDNYYFYDSSTLPDTKAKAIKLMQKINKVFGKESK